MLHGEKTSIPKSDTRNEYCIRDIKLFEIIKVHQLYIGLSDSSKDTYYSVIYGYPKSPVWFPAQIAIMASHTPLKKLLLLLHFKYVYFIKGVFDYDNNLLGFASIVLHGYIQNKLTSRLAIAVRDDYQGRGLGTMLLKEIISEAKTNKIDSIRLDVVSSNKKAVELYKKFGFSTSGIKKEKKAGNTNIILDIYDMELDIN